MEATLITPARRWSRRRILLVSATFILGIGAVVVLISVRTARSRRIQADLERLRAAGASVRPDNWQREVGSDETFFGVFYDIPYYVILRSRPVSRDFLEILVRPPRIVEVRFEGCDLPEDLGPLGQGLALERLDLSRSRVTGGMLASVGPSNQVRRLLLVSTGITGDDIRALSSWPHLRELDLHPSQITPATMKAIESLGSLETLNVSWESGVILGAWRYYEGSPDAQGIIEHVREFIARNPSAQKGSGIK